jgi:hypothetical protein
MIGLRNVVAPNGLVFFTDGSLCGGRAGAAVFSCLDSHATVFQSEVYYAILGCSEYCILEGIVNKCLSVLHKFIEKHHKID